jgi:hypothetical protein
VRKPEGKKSFGRTKRKWDGNNKIDLQEVGCGAMDWIEQTQVMRRWRVHIKTLIKLQVPLNVGNFLTGRKLVNFLRSILFHGLS